MKRCAIEEADRCADFRPILVAPHSLSSGGSALARYLVELVHELDCDVVDPPGEH
jgi:hypothetical protein